MTVGALRPGVSPAQVEPAAAAGAAELTTVEASDVAVVAGEARLTVRFTADDAELAQQIARHTADVAGTFAQLPEWKLTERVGGRWFRR